MRWKNIILILAFFGLPLAVMAQQGLEGISAPVRISVTQSLTGTSKSVYIHVDPGAAGYSKVVTFNVGTTKGSTTLASNKITPVNDGKGKAIKPGDEKVISTPVEKATTERDSKITQATDNGLTTVKTPEPKKEITQENIVTTSVPLGVVNDNQKTVVDAEKKKDAPVTEKSGEVKKEVSAKAEPGQKILPDQKTKDAKPTDTENKSKEVAIAALVPVATATKVIDEKPDAASVKTLTPESSNLPKYYALLIGVSTYAYSSSTFTNLDEPVNDVKKLEKVLVEKYEFAPSNVKKLLNPTRLQILDELDQLARNIKEQDNLLIFYAGHGKWDSRSQVGYWLPSDARPDRKAEWIPNSTLQDYINSIYSKHTLLISDACFGGSIFKERRADFELNEFATSKLYQLQSRKAMTSGNLMTVPDRSKFLEYMVKRLNENEDRFLPARILFDRIYLAVINNTNTVPLYGVVHNTGDEGGEFIFIKRMP